MSKPLNPDQLNELLGLSRLEPKSPVSPDKPSPESGAGALTGAEIEALLAQESRKEERVVNPDNFYKHGFNKACLFLLDLQYENLYEPWIDRELILRYSDGWWWRCKGCGRMVKRPERESHHSWHKKELT